MATAPPPPPPAAPVEPQQQPPAAAAPEPQMLRPSIDIEWYLDAAHKVSKTVPRVRASADAAATAYVNALQSPLVVGAPPCTPEHEQLVKCVESARAAGGGPAAAASEQLRQALSLAAAGSSRHVEAVQDLSRTLPDAMPPSRVGGVLHACAPAMAALRKCTDGAVAAWMDRLSSAQSASGSSAAAEGKRPKPQPAS